MSTCGLRALWSEVHRRTRHVTSQARSKEGARESGNIRLATLFFLFTSARDSVVADTSMTLWITNRNSWQDTNVPRGVSYDFAPRVASGSYPVLCFASSAVLSNLAHAGPHDNPRDQCENALHSNISKEEPVLTVSRLLRPRDSGHRSVLHNRRPGILPAPSEMCSCPPSTDAHSGICTWKSRKNNKTRHNETWWVLRQAQAHSFPFPVVAYQPT